MHRFLHMHRLLAKIRQTGRKKNVESRILYCRRLSNKHKSLSSSLCNAIFSRLGGVVVSVLATGPKGCGFEPGQGDGFLRAIKISSTPSSRMGSKAGRSLVVRFYGMQKNSKNPTGMNRQNSNFLSSISYFSRGLW
jgi:hypothetical protein